MEFRDHLKKTRTTLQWTDHCYFNIGLKSNKAIAKTVQAKEDFEKSDHCYHTFLSCGQNSPLSSEKLDGRTEEIQVIFDKSSEVTEQHKENVSHIAVVDSKQKSSANLKLRLDAINEHCSYSGKMCSKETLGDVSNSPEIIMCGEVIGSMDVLPWEHRQAHKESHEKHLSLEEFSNVSHDDNVHVSIFTVEESTNSQLYTDHSSHTLDNGCRSKKVCDNINLCHGDTELSNSCGNSKLSVNKASDQSIIETADTEQLCNEDNMLEEKVPCLSTSEKKHIGSACVKESSDRGPTLTSQNRRKRSDHSYCDTSSKKPKKAKSGKSDHTYMKSSSLEEYDLAESRLVEKCKEEEHATKGKSTVAISNKGISASRFQRDQLIPFCGDTSLIQANAAPISGINSVISLHNSEYAVVPPGSALIPNRNRPCDSTNVTLLGVVPLSQITELSILCNDSKYDYDKKSCLQTVLSGIGEELASRASRTQQVINAFNVSAAERKQHFVEVSDTQTEDCDTVTAIQSVSVDPITQCQQSSVYLSDSNNLVQTQGILFSSTNKTQQEIGLKSRCLTEPMVSTLSNMLELGQKANCGSGDGQGLQSGRSEGKSLQCGFMIDKGSGDTTTTMDLFTSQSCNLQESALLSESAVSIKCSLPCSSINSNIKASQSTGANKTSDNSTVDRLTPSCASCIPVKLSTNLPLLHNLESGGYENQCTMEQSESKGLSIEENNRKTDLSLLSEGSAELETEVSDRVLSLKEVGSKSRTQSRLPRRKCKKPRMSVVYDKRHQQHSSKTTTRKDPDAIKQPARNRRCSSNTRSSCAKVIDDCKPVSSHTTRKQPCDARISAKKPVGSGSIMVSSSRKMLQAVIIDHTYEEDKFLGQQVSVERDHTYGQGKLKTRKSKLRLQGTNSNFAADHNYEPLA